MAINDRLESISLHLGNAYAKVASKGGTIPNYKNLENLANAIDSITGGSPVVGDVQLNAPSLSLGTSTTTSDPLIITNAYNGNFVNTYDIYDGSTLLTSISASLTSNTINLRDYISTGGAHTIKVIAKGTGFLDSNAASITYRYSSYATVTNNLTNCTTDNNATTVTIGDSYSATLTAAQGYSFVGATISVIMDGADVTSTVYNAGVISIASITGDIVITATFAVITQLGTPTISLDGTGVLTIGAVANATSYDIYLNGGRWKNVITTSFQIVDELVLQGTYVITAKAKADGYLDSNASNSITYVNSSGATPDPVLENNTWEAIRLVCEMGQANTYWSVGDTKTDLGTDGTTRTFQIVDMQGLYDKHVVFGQVELESENYPLNANNYKPYQDSTMRSATLPSILSKYSNTLQALITETTYPVNLTGRVSVTPSDFVYVTDKIFLPSKRELGGSPTSGEGHYVQQFQYYENTGDYANAIRIKLQNGVAAEWWTRSISGHGYQYFVRANGDLNSARLVYQLIGVSPCFAF